MPDRNDFTTSGARDLPSRLTAALSGFAAAVRQFWEGYRQSPPGC